MKCIMVFFVSFLLGGGLHAYDPSLRPGSVTSHLTSFTYGESRREVPLKVYLPQEKNPVATILLSHGLGGNREIGKYVAEHWAARGFVVIAMEHKGSNTEVIKQVPRGRKFIEAKKSSEL